MSECAKIWPIAAWPDCMLQKFPSSLNSVYIPFKWAVLMLCANIPQVWNDVNDNNPFSQFARLLFRRPKSKTCQLTKTNLCPQADMPLMPLDFRPLTSTGRNGPSGLDSETTSRQKLHRQWIGRHWEHILSQDDNCNYSMAQESEYSEEIWQLCSLFISGTYAPYTSYDPRRVCVQALVPPHRQNVYFPHTLS